MGLKGTGSKTVVVDDVFIPDERALRVKEMSVGGRQAPASTPASLYQAGFEFVFSLPVGMPALGAGPRVPEGVPGADQGPDQRREPGAGPRGDAQPAAPGAGRRRDRRGVRRAAPDVRQYCFAPASQFTDLDRAECRRDTSFAAQLCRRAVNDLFESSGGSSLFESSDMQRLWRDTNAAAAHHGLMWDIRGTEFARVLMGLPAAERPDYARPGLPRPLAGGGQAAQSSHRLEPQLSVRPDPTQGSTS